MSVGIVLDNDGYIRKKEVNKMYNKKIEKKILRIERAENLEELKDAIVDALEKYNRKLEELRDHI